MKDIYRNPLVYYAAVPAAVALWPLFVFWIYLPMARENLEKDKQDYARSQVAMAEILAIDPGRLEFADASGKATEFDYAVVIESTAGACGISSASYKLSSGIVITSGGQKSQSAKVVLKDVDISRLASFLSTIQLRWQNIQCTQLKLTRKKGLPDSWDADFDFKYYY